MTPDPTLETGVRSPLERTLSQKPKKSPRQELADKRRAILATPESILQNRLSYVTAELEKATRIEDFTGKLPALPTDIEDATLQAKLEARQMIVEYLRYDKAWLERALKEVKNEK